MQTTAPDLVIYLQTPVDALLKRVEQRNISYEQTISREYLGKLAETYGEFFHHYDASPLLIVNNENLDCATDDSALELLLNRISAMRSRREYFNPRLDG